MGKCLAPMGFSHVLRLCLQGGGVYIVSGPVSTPTVTFDSCTITGNTATNVRAHPQKFPSPRWENALLSLNRLANRLGSYLVLAALPAKCPNGVKRMTFQPCTVVTSQWHRIPYCPRRGPMLLSVEARSALGQQPSRASMAQSQLARHRHHTLLGEHRCRRLSPPRPHRHPLRRATQRATQRASSSASSRG